MIDAETRPDADARIGERIRIRRKSKGLSLADLSAQVGISTGQLSEIERGISSPSIRVLRQLCDKLGTSLGWILGEEAQVDEEEARIVTRRDQRRRMNFGTRGIVKEIVTGGLQDGLQLLLMELRPGAGAGREPYTHTGIEAGLVLAGAIELHVDGCAYQLAAGDAFQFESQRPHHFNNPHAVPASVLWVLSPAMY